MPRKRILVTWLNFAVGVLIFLIVSPLTGKVIEWDKLPLFFIGLKEAGNPTWYIPVIILCYTMSFLAASLIRRVRGWLVITHTLFVAGVGVFLSIFMDAHWYDTIMCYAFGFAYSKYKTELERVIRRHYTLAISICVTVIGFLFYVVHYTKMPWLISFNIMAVVFAMLFVILGMKFRVGNKAINWCGSHLFPIYMYQGLFFNLLFYIGGDKHVFAAGCPFVYTLLSVLLTLWASRYYHLWEIKLSKYK